MMAPPRSSKCGTTQPPYLKLPSVSSCGPPGACMTPSRVTNVRTIIFRMAILLHVKGFFHSAMPPNAPAELRALMLYQGRAVSCKRLLGGIRHDPLDNQA